ncbi:MAG: glycoside hydrolase family 125 protein [Candidatus Nanopelagicaceae bacterium]|nr:glycoside hydrolase family 125 protein [Candidatus Nanopelagicaceae bacterium]
MIDLKEFGGFDSWNRPAPTDRAFYSQNLDQYLEEVAPKIQDQNLRKLFINTFSNTLDTTAYYEEVDSEPLTYIITGDIEAMWLRDSTSQIWHYLPIMKRAPEIRQLIAGLIRRQVQCIVKDPYANAFYNEDKRGIHSVDLTEMSPGVHERKWELDSLCYHLRLCVAYWNLTKDGIPFNQLWKESLGLILQTMRIQQRKSDHGPYFFDRVTDNPIDTLSNEGCGPAYAPTGMIASAFRPSDDACELPFNIPANLFALEVLSEIQRVLIELDLDDFDEQIDCLVSDISKGLAEFATVDHSTFGTIFAYEVDGLGNSILMDDANAPSLLSLPHLEAVDRNNSIYQATRSFVLSPGNPFFYQGATGSGIGSPHTGENQIWPISLIFQALTSQNETEIRDCLLLLIKSSADSGLLHESFDADDPSEYSRPWFAWCNSLFGVLINQLLAERPNLIAQWRS